MGTDRLGNAARLGVAAVMIMVILACVLPMGLNPVWNGEIPEHRNQYEIMAEALLDGRLDLDYGDMDERLLEMENPYDPEAREGIPYHWDHAFYQGRYYMYFGIVPVLLLFLPFRVLAGTGLATYHATQIFTALFISGAFATSFFLRRRFFRSVSWQACAAMAAGACAMSVWYISAEPALYCTAIASGICMEAWSLYFFMKAVWDGDGGGRSTVFGVAGSLLGALAFGCRPTVALANLIAVPLLIEHLRGRSPDRRLVGQLLAVAAPYIAIGACLMAYNHVRFGSPFEFGQSYQLTVADQSGYGSVLAGFDPMTILAGLRETFLASDPPAYPPAGSLGGIFRNFPACLGVFLCVLRPKARRELARRRLGGFMLALMLCPVLIAVVQVLEAPYLLERYRSDFYWIMGLAASVSAGCCLEAMEEGTRRYGNAACVLLAAHAAFRAAFLWLGQA